MNWKWIAAAAGVAYVFRAPLLSLIEGPTAAPAEIAPAQASPWPAAALDTTSTRARLLAAGSADGDYRTNQGTLTVDQWNYYYAQVRGVPAPGAQAIGLASGDQLVTVDEYWAAMTSAGLGRIRRQS